jgi:hypothetical protein
VPDKNSINAHRILRGGGEYDRGNKTIREIETITSIKLKVYGDAKSWINIAGTIQVPDNAIQTIGYMTDLPKILKAKELIVHEGIQDYKNMRFQRSGEHIMMGFGQNRYFACFWSRI